MRETSRTGALILGFFIFLGLAALGLILGNAAIDFKEYERTVTVKGLSEREFEADIVIWPIQFTEAGNDLAQLYASMEVSTAKIKEFLENNGLGAKEISYSSPAITDKSAQQYGGNNRAEF